MHWWKDNELTTIKYYLESRHKNGEAISFEPTGLLADCIVADHDYWTEYVWCNIYGRVCFHT